MTVYSRHTPFLIWNQSIVKYLVLTVASCPAYRFLRRQVIWSSIPISLRIFYNLLWSTQSKVFSSVTQSCPTLCDPMNCSTPGLPVYHQLLEFTQTPGVYSNSCPLSQWCHATISFSVAPSPAFNLSQQQGLFKWVCSLHQGATVLEFQLQHQFFQWTPRTDLLKDGLVGSPCSPRDSQESSPTPHFKSINY